MKNYVKNILNRGIFMKLKSLLLLSSLVTSAFVYANSSIWEIVPFDAGQHRAAVSAIHNALLPDVFEPFNLNHEIPTTERYDVLLVAGSPIGYVNHRDSHLRSLPNAKIRKVSLIAIRADYQRQGYGRVLIQHVENNAIQEGCQYAMFDAIEEHQGSINFCEALGYRQAHNTWMKRLY